MFGLLCGLAVHAFAAITFALWLPPLTQYQFGASP